MSTKDINKNKSKNLIFGILAGVIATMGITGIANISAQSMSATTPLLLRLTTHHKHLEKQI